MLKKLYVGNLPYTATDDQLRDMFTQHGAVSSASVLMDKMTGRSRGFGFVEMENDEEALKAVDALNGTDFDGRKLVVNEARPMTERAPRRGGFGGGGGGGGFSRGGGRGGFGGGY
ncbi:MAG: RNA-binding protein [Candidatus Yanofskybacteria bacterium RIFCSPLOWO2_12_FULL_44_13b]|uniref:RNA-binding protein n=1 Tax=Candidatus Yanofskybacteria bacterium RIFCSPLOWO2_02_FULL_44_18 TaxID=1802705 RepID=A0A1F8H0D2_9BACT|nr:MAG: RNA-binding protein [Candidatus Yanofskybacteria bacterium RIFCSPHIGHO2_01_FULL_44_110b]OGN14647.1 MAG: RNA-binding protein [Candidatus Yanofskybacteria bacterium RIFCSPHIGHO2_02_FULL_44_36b]OGN18717.1 MAG: RNA-binding protein [Candidatus Yanofskybacteria bacterium RIFCSPHIGHO2_12_FULL_44_29b]OGN26063.1 MAG: RNA-binding protein [Candidatus Yanofskybacteria bacterium RIFCSPLOWO2_01_FULL_44_88]OGN30720.1 MAG: RNA-binding protein [Candidatus Yanofskybacteria bacterium RIFCSPLOWO2_02_FULL_4